MKKIFLTLVLIIGLSIYIPVHATTKVNEDSFSVTIPDNYKRLGEEEAKKAVGDAGLDVPEEVRTYTWLSDQANRNIVITVTSTDLEKPTKIAKSSIKPYTDTLTKYYKSIFGEQTVIEFTTAKVSKFAGLDALEFEMRVVLENQTMIQNQFLLNNDNYNYAINFTDFSGGLNKDDIKLLNKTFKTINPPKPNPWKGIITLLVIASAIGGMVYYNQKKNSHKKVISKVKKKK